MYKLTLFNGVELYTNESLEYIETNEDSTIYIEDINGEIRVISSGGIKNIELC